MRALKIGLLTATLLLTVGTVVWAAEGNSPNLQQYPDTSGSVQTFSTNGSLDLQNPFFQSLGSNGRSCATCHQPGDGWTVIPSHVQTRFDATQGMDPIFRPVDGANSPNADVSTVGARRSAYSMLLTKGLIRVGLPIPDQAEFRLTHTDDPYSFASPSQLSLFRRPLPSTNLRFLTTVMWDGRESPQSQTLQEDLISQALHATQGHAELAGQLTPGQLKQIVKFETGAYTAQSIDTSAGILNTQGAKGGPVPLVNQEFFVGINDPLGGNPNGTPFDPNAFRLYTAWRNLKSAQADPSTAYREAVARGEELFNTRPFTISNVPGLTDKVGGSITGTCTTCHDTPNVGDHSVAMPLNLGVSDPTGHPGLDMTGLPVYTLQCGGTQVRTTDPGRALLTGKCEDIGKFKGPILRGLAARAPYFHNGSAPTLAAVVTFYDSRFAIGLTPAEQADLLAFLRAI